MKKPVKPILPTKPVKPKKMIKVKKYVEFTDDQWNKINTLEDLINAFPTWICKKDIKFDYLDFESYYYEEVINKNYPKQIERYNKALQNYNNALKLNAKKLVEYKENLIKYHEQQLKKALAQI